MQNPIVTTVHKQDKQTMIIAINAAGNIVNDPTYQITFNGDYNIKFVGSQLIYDAAIGGTHRIEIRSPLLQCNGGNQRYPLILVGPTAVTAAAIYSDVQFSKFLEFQTFLQGQLQLQLYNVTDNRPLNNADDHFTFGYLYFQLEKIF